MSVLRRLRAKPNEIKCIPAGGDVQVTHTHASVLGDQMHFGTGRERKVLA